MKDIDFDELDRAVSSVLGNNTDSAPRPQVPAPTTPVVPSAVAMSSATPTPSPEPVTVTAPTISKPSSPAIRRGGRFMDVVHPSSDMKHASPSAPRVSRRSLGPISDDLKDAPKSVSSPTSEPVVSEPQTQSIPTTTTDTTEPAVSATMPPASDVQSPVAASENTPKPAVEPFPTLDTLPADSTPRIDTISNDSTQPQIPVATQTWPDPLDLHTPEDDSSKASEETSASDFSVGTDENGTSDVPAPVAPLDPIPTPFLTDTKVEKRPLGAFAEGGSEEATDIKFAPTTSAISPQLEVDLAEIEAKETKETDSPIAVSQAPTAAPISTATEPQVTSIPQQYPATDTSSADMTTQPVFDTSAYHQPLLPPKTHGKSHTWIWILLIIGLLIVGAGLGALFFMAGF